MNPTSDETSVVLEPTTKPVSWLSEHLRSIVALALCTMVCYLAWQDNQQAQAALISAFGLLVGLIFGEQSALKRPNVDH